MAGLMQFATRRLCLTALICWLVAGASAVWSQSSQMRDMPWQVTEIYMATLGHAPDAEGLAYWVGEIQTQANWTPTTVAQSFFDQPLVQAVYPQNQPVDDFIDAMYVNIFGRLADEAGKAYWRNDLLAGQVQRNQMIIALINGGWANPASVEDMARFGNRVRVALAFARYQETLGIVYTRLSASDQDYLRYAGRQALEGVQATEGDDARAIARIPALLAPLAGGVAPDDDSVYDPGVPASLSASQLSESVSSFSGEAVQVGLFDGSRVEVPDSGARYELTLKRASNTMPVDAYFPAGSGFVPTGAMRSVRLSGQGDASALKPIVTFPAHELGTVNPETVVVLRQAATFVGDEWVDGHFAVLAAEFDDNGDVRFVDPYVPDSLMVLYVTPGDDDPVFMPFGRQARVGDDATWVGEVRYSLMTFETDANWSDKPRLVRMIPDADLADEGYRRPASAAELTALARQPICNMVVLVHGHNEEEKLGFEPATAAPPWKVTYKRLVWDLFYKRFLEESPTLACTAFYEFIYPSYRPIFSPVSEKWGSRHETLGESLGRLMAAEFKSNPQLRAMRGANMPFSASIVSHSMGGLVARAGLRFMPAAFMDNFTRLSTWGTPHEGAGLYSLLYGLRVGHDLTWLGRRIPMQNIGQSSRYGAALDGIAIDAPGTRDLRWNARLVNMMALGEVLTENPVTGFEKSEVELPGGSRFYSRNLQAFNDSEGLWMGSRLDDRFSFFYGTTSKMAQPRVVESWLDWINASLDFGDASGIEKGAFLNSMAMQSAWRASDGAVPVFSQRGAGLLRPAGIRRIDTGDMDHEEFYGAEHEARTDEALAKGERVADLTRAEAGLDDEAAYGCPSLTGELVPAESEVRIEGLFAHPVGKTLLSSKYVPINLVAQIQLRRDRPDGAAVSGLTAQMNSEGRFRLLGPKSAVSDVSGTAYVVAVLKDGSEVLGPALSGFGSTSGGERVQFAEQYRFSSPTSSGSWPEALFLHMEGDLALDVTIDENPFRKVVVEPAVLTLAGGAYDDLRPRVLLEIKVPWPSTGVAYSVGLQGVLKIRPSATSGSHVNEGRTVNWWLALPNNPVNAISQTSCSHFGNAPQFTIREDGSAAVSLTLTGLRESCDLVYRYHSIAPYDDSYIDGFGNPWQLRPAYPEIVIRFSGH